jgi:hypothetical protein
MLLPEKLAGLIGHEIQLLTTASEDKRDLSGGILKEIGDDFLLIDTRKEDDAGNVGTAAEWYIWFDDIISIFHPYDCPKCATDCAIQALKRNKKAAKKSLTSGFNYRQKDR